MTHPLIKRLVDLNSKERFFLVAYALGNPGFQLGDKFREDLEHAIGVQVPDDAFCAMDYHLDWIHAAIQSHNMDSGLADTWENQDGCVEGNQEDVDLLVVFETRAGEPSKKNELHMVLVEAKATTGWTNKQIASKAMRLGRILGFKKDFCASLDIVPHFVLTSPGKSPDKLRTKPPEGGWDWPEWMLMDGSTVPHMTLPVENRQSLLKVSRCGIGSEDAGRGFTHWKLMRR